MTPPLSSPMSFSDILTSSIDLAKSTYLRLLGVAAIVFIPSSVLAMVGLTTFYGSMADVGDVMDFESGSVLMQLMGGLVVICFSALLAMLATSATYVGGSRIIASDLRGERLSIGAAIGQTFHVDTFSGFVQYLVLIFCLFAGIMMFGVAAALFGAVVLESGVVVVLMILLMIVLILPTVLLMLFYSNMGMITTSWEHVGPFAGIGRASRLMSGLWWRTFGIWFLLTLLAYVVQFVISIPFFISVFGPIYYKIFTTILEGGGEATSPFEINHMLAGIGWAVGLVSYVSSIVFAALQPIYLSVIFGDLRARKGSSIAA